MNVSTTVNKRQARLISPSDVPLGQVYSWGDKIVSYMRVFGGSVCLTNWDYIPESHAHFKAGFGPRVEVCLKSDLTITYEG